MVSNVVHKSLSNYRERDRGHKNVSASEQTTKEKETQKEEKEKEEDQALVSFSAPYASLSFSNAVPKPSRQSAQAYLWPIMGGIA